MAESSIQVKADAAHLPASTIDEAEQTMLREYGVRAARSCAWLPHKRRSSKPREIFRISSRRFFKLERELYKLRSGEPSEDLKVLYENLRLVRTDIQDLEFGTKILTTLPAVRTLKEESIPRALVLARALLAATNNQLTESAFSFFIEAVQEIEPLRLSELRAMLTALKLILLDNVVDAGFKALQEFRNSELAAPSFQIGRMVRSLRLIGDIDWKETIEQLSLVHRTLCLDPIGVYPRMDFESREFYRKTVEQIAAHSDVGEIELARRAVQMAKDTPIPESAPDALRQRLRHVGYYIVDDIGSRDLRHQIGYRPSFAASVQQLFRNYPDELYIIGIEFLTLITVVALLMSLVRTTNSGFGLIVSALLLIVPATHAAVELMNHFVSALLTPHPLPKFDFSRAIDSSCATMVAIPTLLLNDKQIRQLVDDLEVRYLVNRDPNIFYALLTDLPDTAEPGGEQDHRVDLAVRLIEELNRKHASEPYGGFYLFHRHRVYNPRQGAWMGWERKRGKLLDLNKLLRRVYDPFPIKAGDMSRLPVIQYVLTLDSDTQLPRGSAQRLIGAIAHPLNRPLIDRELNVVTQGYGILQPRVGISVHSATRSRLANIYSGQTGFDVYSRAVSDIYQDLYGEGIFTGKGIYDVDALRQVLEHRFPHNTLLSHDLIEGAYARAGLVSDVEVIDDYPSHYSAYNRRRHRWLRGDWQIARWIFSRVPDESRRLVDNPISLVSKWKIVDNLRRSLIEPATFLLLFAGWFFLPGGPRFWTLLTLALLFLPIYFRLIFVLAGAAWNQNKVAAQEAFVDFGTSHVSILLNIAFLAHQTLVALDAIIRTIVRSTITHSRLLEWETATEAELGINKRTPVDIYLDWMPLIGACLGLTLLLRPEAAPYALPFIVVWCCSKLISHWINRSPHAEDYELTALEHRFLREVALRTWRYFAEFSNEKNNWLIPDNVQEQAYRPDERLSPTNLGLLVNARQAALEFGYVTLSEFVALTQRTLQSMLKLPRYFGHFVNWYDNITSKPLDPLFISSVDSGNLIASLWSLKQHCLELQHEPLVRKNALAGLSDHCRICNSRKDDKFDALNHLLGLRDSPNWLRTLLQIPENTLPEHKESNANEDFSWRSELRSRVEALREEARNFMPWQLPEFEPIRKLTARDFVMPSTPLTPANGEAFYQELDDKVRGLTSKTDIAPEILALASRLREKLPACRTRLNGLASHLKALATEADRLVREMNFKMLVDRRRRLLSVGYDVAKQQLNSACYDLLASESRTATFIGVAKGEVLEDAWFRLGRQHTSCEGEKVLLSWTGTMFEYLMPVIWMKSHPNTLLDRSVRSAVRVHQLYGKSQNVPWGISEAAYSKVDPDGSYQYGAFGVPCLALNVARSGPLVISPYSSCLALLVGASAAVENLRRMAGKKWLGEYGFYESADFTGSASRGFLPRKYELIRCWMAHHQGMTLAALCNVLHDAAFQRWFHAEPVVQASELILQERPLRTRPITDSLPRRILPFARNSAKDRVRKKTPA
jgi:cyclic beta-1,2-glucan synthetase